MERSKIQRLYDACNATFSKGELPKLEEIQWLQNLLDTMEAIDVGIDEFSDERSPFVCRRTLNPVGCRNLICAHGISQITYVHVYECDDFSAIMWGRLYYGPRRTWQGYHSIGTVHQIGVFCFPAGGTLPLHDHPRMTVLSKVLYGSIYIKAYDWVKCWDSNGKIGGLGGMVLDGVYQAPCETSVLFPASGGNIHSFTALTPCAILDVLSPPYSEELGRPSTYYSDIPIPFFPGYAVLEEKELPDDLVVISAPYLGPELAVDLALC